jgi:hypothetical protein
MDMNVNDEVLVKLTPYALAIMVETTSSCSTAPAMRRALKRPPLMLKAGAACSFGA